MQGTNDTVTVLDALRESIREIDAEHRETQLHLAELDARRHELDEQIARIGGDALAAEWHRLGAISCRNRTPENEQAAHEAYVTHMAAMHLRHGTVPNLYRDEIEARMDELRGGGLQ
jgi:seryl-tRNA synthetase